MLKMESETSNHHITVKTAISSNDNGGISCRRCIHRRHHHHRASRSPHNVDGVVVSASFSERRNGKCEQNLEESSLMIRTENHYDIGMENVMAYVDDSSYKRNHSENISLPRLATTMTVASSPLSRKGRMQVQLDEILCQKEHRYSLNRIPTTKFSDEHKHRYNYNVLAHKHGKSFGDDSSLARSTQRTSSDQVKSRSASNHHVIMAHKNFKMIAVLVQITFLAFSLLPNCQASSLTSSLTSTTSATDNLYNGTQHHPLNGFVRGTTQPINISRQFKHRMASLPSKEWNSDTSHLSALMNDEINASNNNDSGGDNNSHIVSGNLSPEGEQEKRVVTRKSTTMKASAVGGIDIPFVRAHLPPGYISHVNGDGSTKGSPPSSASGIGGNLMLLSPQLAGMMVGGDDSSSKVIKIGSCHCWNTTDDGQRIEVECTCTGENMTTVERTLPQNVHRLSVEQAVNFTKLGNDDLKPYRESLRELVLSELPAFHMIENGTFMGLKRLNTIYIHGTPALTRISDAVFNVYLPALKIIRVTHSSLEVVPNLSQLHIKGAALHMVEFENNKISRLIPGGFNGLTTEHLALTYNSLEEIGPSAFAGSTIARLTLKGNPLKILHSNSFVGVDSLRVLDLSETKITYLPTQGLSGLESLRLEKVWTLSVIPSIYHFQELEEAWLTWPYHCCAFEYPETHDPVSFQKYQDYVRTVLNELCAQASANNGSVSSTELPQKNDDKIGDIGDGTGRNSGGFQNELNASVSSQRQKRYLRLFEQANALRNIRSTRGSQKQQQWGRKIPTLSPSSSSENNLKGNREVLWINENSQTHQNDIYKSILRDDNHVSSERDVFLRKLISMEPLVTTTTKLSSSRSDRTTTTNPSVYPRYFVRLKKRSANGNHPRQAQKRSSDAVSLGKNQIGREKNGQMSTDGFHHPHVYHGGSISGGSGGANNPHPFDNDDGKILPYGKMEPADTFDPFVFDPDQSFAPILDPHDLERESDILGKDSWGTFGHASEAEFDEEIGVFHPSVTPSPTVITLCGNVAVKRPPKISCHPLPDAFNPCEDIMGSIWLRGAVWVVVSLALVGNSAVLIVLLLAPGRISVQRFLMANLSWADLCMGIYLLMVATQDLVSLGSYFNYAIDWQLGWGCQIAGFLTVFASELSVFTLAVITGERWYALTRAIHLTKRLTLFGAAQLMAFGWFMSIMLAALPLMGVSSFSKTSICLPMEAHTGGAVAYLIFLLLFNGVAFLLVACAYWQMYRAVAGHGGSGCGASPAASSADTAIAKKMALLVFTDFACWAPVAFFGLTAVGGMPLIGVTDAKILLVFFYPLNACCNPYLYAIITKQYRRDLLLLLSRHGLCTKRAARYKTGAASTNNTMQTMQTVLRMGSMTETKVAGGGGGGRGSLLVNGGRSSSVVPNNSNEDEGLLLMSSRIGIGTIAPTSSSSSSQNKLNKEQEKNELQTQPNMLDRPFQPKQHHSTSLKSSCEDFRKALNLHPPPIDDDDDDDDDDVFDINGLSGRHIAETTFISIPISVSTAASSTGINNGGAVKNKKFPENGGSTLEKVGNGDPAKEKLIQHVVEQHPHQQQQHDKKTSPNLSSKDKLTNNASSGGLSTKKEEHDLEHEITETTPFCT